MAVLLVAYKADVNVKDNHGITAVHRAAYNNKSAGILTILIANNANINEKDNEGNTPLHWAAFYGKKIPQKF